jgi:type VI secretion system protein VasD
MRLLKMLPSWRARATAPVLPTRELLVLALACAPLTGCGGSKPPPPPPPPPTLELTVAASADLNPGADKTPQPVAVHLYQLAATQKFSKADVFALTEHEQATLGADDLGSTDFVIKPSEKLVIKQDLKADAQAVGVLALFYDIDNAAWRASAPVAANGPSKLELRVEKLSVSLKQAGKPPAPQEKP